MLYSNFMEQMFCFMCYQPVDGMNELDGRYLCQNCFADEMMEKENVIADVELWKIRAQIADIALIVEGEIRSALNRGFRHMLRYQILWNPSGWGIIQMQRGLLMRLAGQRI